MKRFTPVLGSMALIATIAIGMKASQGTEEAVSTAMTPLASESMATPSSGVNATTLNLYTTTESAPMSGMTLIAITDNQTKAPRTQASRAVSLDALSGTHVLTFNSLLAAGAVGGQAVTIERMEGVDSIRINDFGMTGAIVRAHVDPATGEVTIPNQIVGQHQTYGPIDIAICTPTAQPDRANQITGQVNEDGTISIDSWWGIYIQSGADKDKYFMLSYQTLAEKANATMTQTLFDGRVVSYGVVVKQPSANVVSVKNFANYGCTVEMVLNRDETATIESQIARYDATNGNWSTKAITYQEDGSALTGYSNVITTQKAGADKKTITWNDWTLLTTGYYLGICVEGKVVADFDISYPTLSVSEFEGEGTAESPYLLKTLDDMLLLSDKVAEATAPTFLDNYNNELVGAYKDTYFRLANDIDMSGYRFTPIGADYTHTFDGILDGNGHTINGLTLNNANSFTGLFGRLGRNAVVKNVNFTNPSVTASGSYCGVICGWSMGLIDNCNITGASVYNTATTAAGVAGIAYDITNCSVTNSTIAGEYGFNAGVAGELDHLGENCHVSNTTINVGKIADGYPSGGVFGTIFRATARNCSFAGKVDSNTFRAGNQFLGGIAGNLYNGVMENCVSVGQILGYDNQSRCGGLVGNMTASVLQDSYSSGMVWSSSSRFTGGITGYLTAGTDEEQNIVHPTVKNCFSANFVTAECYMYKPHEVRESFGTINENCEPVIENCYFDNQVVNLTSTRFGATTEFLTSGSGIPGYSPDVWVFTEGQYPRLKSLADSETSLMASSAIFFQPGSGINKLAADAELHPMGGTTYSLYVGGQLTNTGHYSSIENGVLKINTDNLFGSDTIFVINPAAGNYYHVLKVAPIPFDGDGSELNPYKIQTKEDLIKLSEVTTVNGQLFADTYFLMTNDIDLELDERFLGICTKSSDAHNMFEGTFDGGGHTIHRMYIKPVIEWTTTPENDPNGRGKPKSGEAYKGFIGRLATQGVVRNINFAADCKLEKLWASTGAVVGSNKGRIENCRNYADVSTYSCWVGGIAGQSEANSVISNCYNAGNITSGYFNAGGISGNTGGTIENCVNVGDISVISISDFILDNSDKLRNAGGIAGGVSGCLIRNCVNAGTVYARYGRAGGIVSNLPKATTVYAGANDVVNCVNYGMVSTGTDQASVGAIGGENGSDGNISGVYYDGQILPLKPLGVFNQEGMTPAETSTLISGTPLEGYDTDIWQFDAGMYPVLRQFADEPVLVNARRAIFLIPAGVTAGDYSESGTVTRPEGCVWSLESNTDFKLEGDQVIAPPTPEIIISDILTVTFDNYAKSITLTRKPAVPLAGKGTQEEPYLLTSAQEWNALASFMELTGESFEGMFLKVANDIDFDGVAFKPIGADNVTFFKGTLDGNGKTISNISFAITTTYSGAFGVIAETAVINDLTLAGNATATVTNAGAFAGKIQGKLNNCVNLINLTSTKGYATGFGSLYKTAEMTDCVNKARIQGNGTLVAGFANAMEDGVVLTRCGNEGTVYQAATAASTFTCGLLGQAYSIRLTECYNSGAIDGANIEVMNSVAGLIGNVAGKAGQTGEYILTRCYNSADITANNLIGGLVATSNASATVLVPIQFIECYNTGDIISVATKTTSSSPAAGIAAMYPAGSKFTGCWNSGTISQSKNVYAAGIAGYYKSTPTADNPTILEGCYNIGDINAEGNQGGGIVGYAANNTHILNCHNSAKIEGGFGLGGICATLGGVGALMDNCYNTGDVTTSTNRAGGLMGYNASKATISNSWNSGNVSTLLEGQGTNANESGYGIGGLAGTAGVSFINCYNVGTVKGASQVGGLTGCTTKKTATAGTSFKDCYNAGKVIAPADTCGGIFGNTATGYLVDKNAKWLPENEIENTYYVTDFNTFDEDHSEGIAITLKELASLDLGSGFSSADNYSLPVVQGHEDIDHTKVHSAQAVFADGDDAEYVTSDFKVGAPDGLVWTASVANLSFSGNDAIFSDEAYNGEILLTATAGEASKTIAIQASKKSSVDELESQGKTIVDAIYFNLSGQQVPAPVGKDGQIYLLKATYDDGTTEVITLINK